MPARSPRHTSRRSPAPKGSLAAFQAAVEEAVSSFGATVAPLLLRDLGSQEDALRRPFVTLLEKVGKEIGRPVRAHGEVRLPELAIRPDYLIGVNGDVVGYAELKAPRRGVPSDSWRPSARERTQWKQLQLLPNVLYTDGETFALYRWGKQWGPLARLQGDLRRAGSKLRPADANLSLILQEFLYWQPDPPHKLEQLIWDSARLCQLLRDEALEALKFEADGQVPRLFTHHLNDWRSWLFPHLSRDLFADAYAQTVTFGLLLARRAGIAFEAKELPTIGRELAKSHLLVGRALSILTEHQDGPSIEARSVALQTLRRVVGASDWTDWRGDSFDKLYEQFLSLYDPDLRRGSGSYFTPRPVADFIVRFVDGLLQAKLNRRLGFANHDVVVVDPAMGTGTFLLSAMAQVAANTAADGGDEPAELQALMERLVGFERHIAPYAVAELKLHQELASRGVEVGDEKVRFFVTDTLDDPTEELLISPYIYKPLADSRNQATKVQREERVMVVMGNPPYLENAKSQAGVVLSRGRGKPSLLDDFRGRGTGRLEIKLHNLNVYFWRWACRKVFEAHPENPEGVIAFVTTSAYTTGPGFVGMREYLRRQADWGWIIDLSPEGHQADVSTRIFPDVQHPICVGVFARAGTANTNVAAYVRHLTVSGTRAEKFKRLERLTEYDAEWQDCSTDWNATFRPADAAHWSNYPPVAAVLPWSSAGVKPNRTWVYAPEIATLADRWRRLLMADPSERPELMKETRDRAVRFQFTPDFDGKGQPKSLTDEPIGPPRIRRIAYRSFDRQYLIADRRVVDFPRADLWATHGGHQIYATTLNTEPLTQGPAVVFAAEVPDMHHLLGHHGGRVFPLYRDASARYPNFSPGLLGLLSQQLCTDVTAEDLMAYVAAIASHHGFTTRFGSELQTPGVRIPITADCNLWNLALGIGRQVIWLHTYGERYIDLASGRPPGVPLRYRPRVIAPISSAIDTVPEKIEYCAEDSTLRVGDGILGPIDAAVWNYEISGMHVVKRWFEYRTASPRVRRSSPLNEITPRQWKASTTEALRELVALLHGCILLEPKQTDLLGRVIDGPLVTTTQLKEARILPPPPSAARPMIEFDPTIL